MKAVYYGPYLVLHVNENDMKYYHNHRNSGGAFNMNVGTLYAKLAVMPNLPIPNDYREVLEIAQRYKNNGTVIFVMKELEDKLTKDQLEAVIYHEIGHSAMKHVARKTTGSVEAELEADAYSVQFTSKKALREALTVCTINEAHQHAGFSHIVNNIYKAVFEDEVYKTRMAALQD